MTNGVVTLLCRSGITMETVEIEPEFLNAMEIIGSWSGRAKWWHVITEHKVVIIDSRVKVVIRIISQRPVALAVDHDVSTSEINGNLLNYS